MRINSAHIECLMIVLLCALSVAPMVQATPKIVVDFSLASHGQTVYLTAWAQGELPSKTIFVISIWYNAQGTQGFVPLYSGQLMLTSTNGLASTAVHATTPDALHHVHYFVQVNVYDASNGTPIASAGYDPRTGGGNGGAG